MTGTWSLAAVIAVAAVLIVRALSRRGGRRRRLRVTVEWDEHPEDGSNAPNQR